MRNKNKLMSFSNHLNQEYGKKDTKIRQAYEQEFESFELGVMLQELRKEKSRTKEQLT